MKDKIFVVARNQAEFRIFRKDLTACMSAEGIPFNSIDIVYVTSVDQLRGYSSPWGYLIGNWRLCKASGDIEQLLLTYQAYENFIELDGIKLL